MVNRKPLAYRSRPNHPTDLVGQEHIWREGSPLWNLAADGSFHSLIFWGPPGTGKTSLAHLVAAQSGRPVRFLSAVSDGVKEIRAVLEASSQLIAEDAPNLVLFMDEIHRLNKNQQDVLLPALEDGTIKFIGATTENPSFEVNNAILSRSMIYQFRAISTETLAGLLKKVAAQEYAKRSITEEVANMLAHAAAGDARRGLNLLEALMASVATKEIAQDAAQEAFGSLQVNYDRDGEGHFDAASALIKSIRASHPDAAVHYLGRMLSGGEDPMFIARRLVIAASEDIGNANPTALLVATSGMQAVHMVGMPEARIILSQMTTYLAASPKSNRSYLAINKAMEDIDRYGLGEIPLHLRNAPTQYMKDIGYGKKYVYPHDDLEGAKQLAYLPVHLKGKRYYQPHTWGIEGQLSQNLDKLRPQKD